jgi:hypothetical protein
MGVTVWREFQGAPQGVAAWDATPSLDQAGIPAASEELFLPAAGFPWGDSLEDPEAVYDPQIRFSQDPTVFDPTAGNAQIVGAFDGAYETRGPVVPFGYEVSGGLAGDQAYGRTMRFANNGPERYDPNGVQFPDWADELAASLYYNGQGFVSENESTTNLIQSL